MTRFDDSQRRVLALDPERHARVLGAPGTGKTLTLIESCERVAQLPGWSEEDLLVIAPNRLAASDLRARLERRADRALGGTRVRTSQSLAFSLLARVAATAGHTGPRLLTGPVHDEVVAETLGEALEGGERGLGGELRGVFTPEAMGSASFRAEVRELWRVLDDFALAPAELNKSLLCALKERPSEAHTRAPAPELVEQWRVALRVIEAVAERLTAERPDECTSSGLLRRAAATLHDAESELLAALSLPRLVLVDDAGELGEGQLALLAACAARGTSVWVFGDPDTATGAFQGERTDVLSRLASELARRGAPAAPGDEQVVTLGLVHRHGDELRRFVRGITERIGAAGVGEQRAAASARTGGAAPRATGTDAARPAAGQSGAAQPTAVQFSTVPTLAEQLGVIAHRLRRRRLGLDDRAPVVWEQMAVICRSRQEAARAARVLAGHQVPASVAAGGVVLRENQLVRELIRLLQHALGIAPLTPAEVLESTGGVVGGLDPIALRRLRGALRLQESRAARETGRDPVTIDELVAAAFANPGEQPVVDSAGGRALRRIGRLCAEAVRVRDNGGTARETLWALWDGAGLAARLQEEALQGRGSASDEAHRLLDAVLGLFFALQRHEEQDSATPIAELLEELLVSTVPEDSLAARSERDVVTVTTPQGVIGREFELVCIIGPQDGTWPNLRARGSLLGVTALERWLRGGAAEPPARRDTLHDELRLFAHSCARARSELLAVAVADEDHHPSSFFGLGREHAVGEPLPTSRLTLRGVVAEMRRRLVRDPRDSASLNSLVALAAAGVPGADPDEWYGVRPPSTEAPLVDLAEDPGAFVRVSPSHLETVERCPLDWAVSRLGGGTSGVASNLGTLLHRALETAQGSDAETMLDTVTAEWRKLPFEASWESERTLQLAHDMVRGLAEYLGEFEESKRELVGREVGFSVRIDRARLVGVADRLEARPLPDGRVEVSVVDLKTGKKRPSATELEAHAQLQAYQLGVIRGAFAPADDLDADDADTGGAEADSTHLGLVGPSGIDIDSREAVNGGARLLYVHPDAVPKRERARTGHSFTEESQTLLDPETQSQLEQRVTDAAAVMAGSSFTARIEHHCGNRYSKGGSCRLHIIPAVSHA